MKYLLSLFTVFVASMASALNYSDMALELGFRNQNADISTAGADTNAQIGYQLGLSTTFPIADQWSFRSGLFYTQKNVEVEVGTTKSDVKFTYVEIPATAMFKFADFGAVYAGLNLSINMDDDCGATACSGVESLTTPVVIGANFKFAPQLGGNVYFEAMSGDASNEVSDFKAIGANLMVSFD